MSEAEQIAETLQTQKASLMGGPIEIWGVSTDARRENWYDLTDSGVEEGVLWLRSGADSVRLWEPRRLFVAAKYFQIWLAAKVRWESPRGVIELTKHPDYSITIETTLRAYPQSADPKKPALDWGMF